MFPQIKFIKKIKTEITTVFFITSKTKLETLFAENELTFIKEKFKNKENVIEINRYAYSIILVLVAEKSDFNENEKIRRNANKVFEILKKSKQFSIQIEDKTKNSDAILSFIEGFVLSSYQFDKYKSKKEEGTFILFINEAHQESVEKLLHVCKAVNYTKDLINEPLNELDAQKMADTFKKMGKEAGFKVTVYDKKQIEKLNLTGLLTVNKGSVNDPTYTVMEWKPKNPIIENPIVIVGKGIVYDTGGINLKSYEGMQYMKSDMSGAATVAGIMYALAANNSNIHVIGLAPATDNRPSGNACVSGDIITMKNGVTVEVMNTDAEGRLILADVLVHAQSFDPTLVIDIATLTGSAAAAIGRHAAVIMGTATKNWFRLLELSANNTYERVVQFPLWDEYEKSIESKVADIKNVGDKYAGAITAGKFLQHFAPEEWIHMDIAGPAFITEKDSYKGIGATAYGVRLLYDFFKF